MHRKPDLDLFPIDTELERALRSLRKVSRVEKATMADERINPTVEQETAVGRPPIQDTIEAKSSMVQQNQFTGHPNEDPNEHLSRFLRMENTVKLNGVRPEVIKQHLFPFSLRDITATWYESLPYGSVDTWEELVEAFLGRFFPHPSQLKEEGKS